MIRKISDILKDKERTYSFEFFAPKTEKGMKQLFTTVGELAHLQPDFFSVTYGAGGGNRKGTMDIVNRIQEEYDVTTIHHITCIGHSKKEIDEIISNMKQRNVYNVLALRGDPPEDMDSAQVNSSKYKYSYQLCNYIRMKDDFFSIGVAGFPEGHIDAPDKETDALYLKKKIDSGADFVITQLFFENRLYFDYVKRLRGIGVTSRIIPGILPITNYRNLVRFCARCGAKVPQEVHDIFRPIQDDLDATYAEGIKFVVRQCRELLSVGAPGLHFFTLNRTDPAREILQNINR